VLLPGELVRVQIAEPALARDGSCHGISEYICDDCQEDQRYKDCLRLEVEDLLQYRCED
jgi:hypothetical protein